MKLEKSFDLDHPRDAVWRAMSDVRLVAECLPGASIVEKLGEDRYKGRFAVKLGPMAASFDGDIGIFRTPEECKAIVSGKGSDARTSSRASGNMTYVLSESAPGKTHVNVVSEINLAGALAQFGKGAILQEIANRITAEFVRNFETRLGASASTTAQTPGAAPGEAARQPLAPEQTGQRATAASQLDAGNLIWSVVRDRVAGLFARLFGRKSGRG